ncbi:MAG TPA: prepilin-type N-terminal cleavage/methylation domain-containing protein [Bryobacteraceae bacterium]|jgi:prepilin-type N-terminal cleavage/methylation domain-containing protein|nr:prepilin-type N-terminal cleavage/methylation domain-containing protein [Bryobacteraceae bacterium]
MRRQTQAGVTLIELLITITLLSGLSMGLLFAMRVSLNAMEKANARVNANRRVLGVDRVFSQQVAGFLPTKVTCSQGSGAPGTTVSMFQGEPASMRFISTYSLNEASRGYPRLLEYQVIPTEDGRGVRLIVNERLYSGPSSLAGLCLGVTPDPIGGFPVGRFRSIEVGGSSFVLADRLAYCRMLYREDLPPPAVGERWVPRYIRFRWPAAIRIEMAPLEPDPGRLQLSSVTEVIRIQRDPFQTYGN